MIDISVYTRNAEQSPRQRDLTREYYRCIRRLGYPGGRKARRARIRLDAIIDKAVTYVRENPYMMDWFYQNFVG